MLESIAQYTRMLETDQPLPVPKAVTAATDHYLKSADVVAQWLSECTQERGETLATVPHKSYIVWCEDSKKTPLSSRAFALWPSRRYDKRHSMNGTKYPLSLAMTDMTDKIK